MYGRRRAKKKYTGIGFALFTHFPSLDKQRRQIYIVLNAWFYCITTYKVFVTNAYILKGNITGAPSVCSMVNFDFSHQFMKCNSVFYARLKLQKPSEKELAFLNAHQVRFWT